MIKRLVDGTTVLLCACALLLAGCGAETPTPTGPAPVDIGSLAADQLDAHRTLGEPIHVDNLTVWPVYTDAPLDIGEFLTLQEAQERKVAIVRELGGAAEQGQQRARQVIVQTDNDLPLPAPVTSPTAPGTPDEPQTEAVNPAASPQGNPQVNPQGNPQINPQGGSEQVHQEVDLFNNDQQLATGGAEVSRVVIENKGELPILVVAGTIIDGGNQDRQIGQDFVIAAGKTVDVDAFCVEHGRWGSEAQASNDVEIEVGENLDPSTIATSAFSASKSAGIAPKLVRTAGQYQKDQGKVWAEVASSNAQLKTENPTDTLMGAIDEADEKTKAKRAAYETGIADAFAALAKGDNPPVGFAYAVNGKPVTVRAFAHARIMRSQLPLFLKAMAVEAHMVSTEKAAQAKATAIDVIAMVRGIQAARKAELVKTRASNVNIYFQNDVGFNARCRLSPAMVEGFKLDVGPDHVVITEDWTAK